MYIFVDYGESLLLVYYYIAFVLEESYNQIVVEIPHLYKMNIKPGEIEQGIT